MIGTEGMFEGARFASPQWLAALWLLPVIAAILASALVIRSLRLRRLADPSMQRRISAGGGAPRAIVKGVLVLGAMACVVIALARPQWNESERKITRTGRDVVFLVDVSRSMLARDLLPSRLAWAKEQIGGVLREARGDRIGLVAFAGVPVVLSPLTLDYGFVDIEVEGLSPEIVSVGGTKIGDAIRRTLSEVFDNAEGRYRDIILISDGEDHDSFVEEAAQEAAEAGVRIIAIGVGDPAGATIPVGEPGMERPLTFRGEVVRTRLERETMERIARATPGGVYLHVATDRMDLASVYNDLVTRARGSETDDLTVVEYEEKFQWFVGAALLLLVLEGLIGATRRN